MATLWHIIRSVWPVFERDAKTLAALNHPNIAIIHGFEDANPSTGSGQAVINAIVMEHACTLQNPPCVKYSRGEV